MLKILISKFAQYTYTDYTNSATLEDYWGGTSVPVKMPLNRLVLKSSVIFLNSVGYSEK